MKSSSSSGGGASFFFYYFFLGSSFLVSLATGAGAEVATAAGADPILAVPWEIRSVMDFPLTDSRSLLISPSSQATLLLERTFLISAAEISFFPLSERSAYAARYFMVVKNI